MTLPERSKEEWHTLFVVCFVTSAVFTIAAIAAFVAALVLSSLPVVVLGLVLIVGAFALAFATFRAGMR